MGMLSQKSQRVVVSPEANQEVGHAHIGVPLILAGEGGRHMGACEPGKGEKAGEEGYGAAGAARPERGERRGEAEEEPGRET